LAFHRCAIHQFPVFAVQKIARMQNLLAQGKAPEVVAQFAGEDMTKWPFWKRGDGYLARGRAHLIDRDAQQAGEGLAHALEWPPDERARKAAQQGLESLQPVK